MAISYDLFVVIGKKVRKNGTVRWAYKREVIEDDYYVRTEVRTVNLPLKDYGSICLDCIIAGLPNCEEIPPEFAREIEVTEEDFCSRCGLYRDTECSCYEDY